ncbi:tetratricopeptide repeat protein [Rhodocytophaga aerolata]|uniref:Tetratricopeptide repeat protein n=1 Tax=Rhodocytophaga aerolata TaxID=455078 RepID=A0ABT8RIV2_9BACT|nr:tetratricopeptide repeat protein [Rhodocytophaga aerolata]MDO1451909.1 tetratricopeptide repeat protein [Rhodocytophaga aerolata]
MDNSINRAQLLLQHKKYEEAEKLLKDLLHHTPNDVHLLALLAEAKIQQDKIQQADSLLDTAIGLSPDLGHLFYMKARIALQQQSYDEAEKHIRQATMLDASDADYFSVWASIKLARKQYAEALELANKALELDAQNLLGLNTRSTALLKLNQKESAFNTIEGALRADPTNAYTHANYGWGLLEKGDHKKALEHFKEALKNDPNSNYAQAGMVEALKANNLFYKLFLQYAFWIGNLTKNYQWGVIIGFYVGFRVLRSIAKNNEALQPFLIPLIVLLAFIAFSTWVITPISNLFLRLNAYGKHLLDNKEKMSSNFVGISFLVFLFGVITYFITSNDKFLTFAVFGFAMMLPYSTMFSAAKAKYSLIIYAGVMTLIGMGAIVNTFRTGEIFNVLTPVFIIGFVAFQWVANYLLIKEDNV